MPMMAKNSGSTTSFAPCSAALAIRRRASLRLPSTLGPDAIWMAATLKALSCAAMRDWVLSSDDIVRWLSKFRLFRRGRGRRSFPEKISVLAGGLNHLLHLRFRPASIDIVFKRDQLIERIAQYLVRQQHAHPDRRSRGKGKQRHVVADGRH